MVMPVLQKTAVRPHRHSLVHTVMLEQTGHISAFICDTGINLPPHLALWYLQSGTSNFRQMRRRVTKCAVSCVVGPFVSVV